MDIKISIIIATYNSEQTLKRALDSVKNQNISCWECLIIDGLSSDGTLEIVKKYVSDDSRFCYISEHDKGIYDALNKGIRLAKGEWIYILGSDDELLPDGINKLMVYSEGFDCVYGDVYVRDNKGTSVLFASKSANVLPTAICCSHQAIIMRRKILLALGGFDLQFRISADYDIILRAYKKGYRFNQTHVAVAYFAKGEGVSSKMNFYVIREQFRLYKKNKLTKCPALVVL